MRRGKPKRDDLVFYPPREEIDRCLNCTRPECDELCGGSRKNGRLIRCVELGQLFKTQKDAAAFIGLSASSLSKCLLGLTGTCGGFHFEYVTEE